MNIRAALVGRNRYSHQDSSQRVTMLIVIPNVAGGGKPGGVRSGTSQQIRSTTDQGIISAEQGILALGIYLPKQKSLPNEVFGTHTGLPPP